MIISPPVHVISCQVVSGIEMPQANDIGLVVRFQNTSTEPLRSIVWRAKYGSGWADFVDDGTFAPSTTIDNYLSLPLGTSRFNWGGTLLAVLARNPYAVPGPILSVHLPQYVSLDDPENCSIVRTVAQDGAMWKNDTLPNTPLVLPSPTPSPNPRAHATPTPAPSPGERVAFANCALVFPSSKDHATLGTVYRNEGSVAADRIVIRASYGDGTIDFTDQGTFSPGARIQHELKTTLPAALASRAYASLDDPRYCQAISVHYVDGTQWNDSSTPPPEPTPVPNALEAFGATHYRVQWKSVQADWAPRPSPTPTPSASPTPSS